MRDSKGPKPRHSKMTGARPSGEKRGRKTAKMSGEDAERLMHRKVKTARGRKISSKLWIERQINDPYVIKARSMGYRSRAAFKLIELDEKYRLISKNSLVVDLGCAPGGWLQVGIERGAKHVIGIDILPVEPVPGADIIEMDFMDETAPDILKTALGGKSPSLVMSDLAANTTGHKKTDHLRTVALVEVAADFAMDVLAPGGHFITKVFQGGAEGRLLERLKHNFKTVKHAKPKSSRAGSPEMYLVALGFHGRN